MYPPCPARFARKISRISTLIALALVAVATLFSVACSHAAQAPAKTGAGRAVRAGIFNFKPLVIFDQKSPPTGFIVDILNHIAKQEEWNIEYVTGTWQESLERLKTDKIDIILCIGYSAERDVFLDFPKEHVLLDWGLVYRKKGSSINTILDMEGKTIAAMKASIYLAGFKNTLEQFHIKAKILEKTEVKDVFGALESGEADAAISSTISGLSFESSQTIDRSPVVFTPVKLGYAVNSGKNADLTAAIDKRLAELKSDKNSYYYKKLDEWVIASAHTVPKVVYWIIGGISGTLCVFIVFVIILRWQVRAKTNSLRVEIEQKTLAVEALRQSREDLDRAQQVGQIGSWRLNTQKNELIWSDENHRIFGVPKDTPLTYESFLDTIHPDDRQYVDTQFQAALRGAPYDIKHRLVVEGQVKWVREKAFLEFDGTGALLGGFGITQDITEMKQAESKLLNTQRLLAETEKLGKVGGWEFNIDTGLQTWTNAIYDIHEVDSDFVPSIEAGINFYTDSSRKIIADSVQKAIEFGEPYDVELEIITAKGNLRNVHAIGNADLEGRRVFGFFQDITERKQIEEVQSYLLQISAGNPGEDFFETLARYLAKTLGMDYVCIDTLHGDCLSARTLAIYNDGRFEDNVEYTLKDTPCGDVVGKEVCVFPRQVRYLFPQDAALQDLQAESYVGTTLWSFDMKPIGLIAVIGRKELNSSHFAETVLKLVSVRAAGELERRQAEAEKHLLEQQFQQTQKMESVGRLAGGVAHDFNNMLGVILGHAHLALMETDPAQPLHANLEEIRKAAERSADLTRQLLAFARKQTIAPKVLDLNDTVSGMLMMLQRLIGEDMQLVWQPANNLWPVKADPSQIDQIMANLCVNARDSIRDIGTITIETGNRTIDENYAVQNPEATPGEYVTITVSDNGCGMDKETVTHIFEPFFTTKGVGEGTGLGLSTVYGAVKQNGGFITVYSEPGKGTTFSIYLPRETDTDTARSAPNPEIALPRGQETILLVEDEPAILNITSLMLEKQGYTVLKAATPDEAMQLTRDHVGSIHLLMTDVIMPEMNGRDLAGNILALHPAMKRLFMSGYTADVIAHHGVLDEGVHFIQKPFSLSKMAAMVREVLDCNP